jgi:hypothetical protein
VLGRYGKGFNAYDTLKDSGCLRIMCGRGHDSRTVNEIYPPGQGDILPNLRYEDKHLGLFSSMVILGAYLGFSWHRCDAADLTTLEGINDAALAYVWVSNKSDGNLLFI